VPGKKRKHAPLPKKNKKIGHIIGPNANNNICILVIIMAKSPSENCNGVDGIKKRS
jgi:hypothetical protein